MLCIGSWLKKPTLELENLSLKSRVSTGFYIVDVSFDALFVNEHCCVLLRLHFVTLFVTLASIQQLTSFNILLFFEKISLREVARER